MKNEKRKTKKENSGKGIRKMKNEIRKRERELETKIENLTHEIG